ncbi:MAG: low temperature requirement protein A [Microlunatus sp.]|nr:low temperature requirement protein A [Microlunatus sp.]
MTPRDPEESHRTAGSLELFFDLVFVVAVSVASANLHHLEAEEHIVAGVGAYLLVMFAVWWAWMNFTWFATSFDTDDWLYRVTTIIQMAGALVMAAGAAPAMLEGDFTVVILGYVVMRLAMVAQWLRAAKSAPELRSTALRYAVGITALQILWVLQLRLPESLGLISVLVLIVAEVSIPILAERRHGTPWHRHHITERYGLFTLILLGETILASTNAIIDAIAHSEQLPPLLLLSACGLILAAGMWWTYFWRPMHSQIADLRSTLIFGYGHYVIFAAAGAFSAGVEVAIDYDTHATELSGVVAAATTTVPVALFVLGIWALSLRRNLPTGANVGVVGLAVAIGLSALLPFTLVIAALLMITLVALLEVVKQRDRLMTTSVAPA